MADYGSIVADRAAQSVARQLKPIYKTAQQELQQKLEDFESRHAAKDKQMQQKLADGRITREEYQDWLRGQVFIRKQWNDKISQVNQVILHANQEAARIVHENKLNVFIENYNFNAFVGEQIVGGSFNIYNTQAVAKLIKEHPKVLPEWKIDKKKDYKWNYKKVNNIVNQGIIQGESVDEIAKRLCNDLSTQNENKMRLFARTAITGAQNAGRQQQMDDASQMGIEQHKQWLATMDANTRDAHRALDGQEVPYNESFESPLGPIDYPGDPSADPKNTYNCRCTIVTIYPKYEKRDKPNWRESIDIDGQSYKEWKNGKQKDGKIVGQEKNHENQKTHRHDSV